MFHSNNERSRIEVSPWACRQFKYMVTAEKSSSTIARFIYRKCVTKKNRQQTSQTMFLILLRTLPKIDPHKRPREQKTVGLSYCNPMNDYKVCFELNHAKPLFIINWCFCGLEFMRTQTEFALTNKYVHFSEIPSLGVIHTMSPWWTHSYIYWNNYCTHNREQRTQQK